MLNVMLNGKDLIVTLVPKDDLGQNDFEVASKIIDTFIQKHEKINGIIISCEELVSWDKFVALLSNLNFINQYERKVPYISIVCDAANEKVLSAFSLHFTNAVIEKFSCDSIFQANSWIKEDKNIIVNNGLSIGIQRTYKDFILKLKACGTLTNNDYEIINPMLNNALDSIKDRNVNILIDIKDFHGWEVKAAWNDLKLGLKNGYEFEKIAIYGNSNKFMEYGNKISSWFQNADIQEFSNQNNAVKWLENRI